MRIIAKPTETVTAVMSAAPATTMPSVMVDKRLEELHGEDTTMVALNGTTPVTLSAPVSGLHTINRLSICNVDTAQITVTFKRVVGGVTYTVLAVTLDTGDHFFMDENGCYATDSFCQRKVNSY